MKSHFNVVFDTRDDGTRVWSAKCLQCDAVIVGEVTHAIPIVEITMHVPPIQVENIRRQVLTAWELSRKTGNPIVVPGPGIEVKVIHEQGLQRALDAHIDSCMPKLSKDYK